MKYAEKLIKIADNEPKVYEAGCRAGVKKGKAELAESLDPTLDNIITTLDEMLTLQESLMPKLPTFTFYVPWEETYTLEYEEGMTWSEWCASEYNTIGIYINEEHYNSVYYGVYLVMDADTSFYFSEFDIINPSSSGYYVN